MNLKKNVNLKKHISKVKQSGFYMVSNLGRIRNLLTTELRPMLVKQLILFKVDYHNGLYANLPKCEIKKLQSVVNAAVRFIYNAGRRVPAKPLLIKAHILPVKYRIKYKICLLTHKALNGELPDYMCTLIKQYVPRRGNIEGNEIHDTTPGR